MRRPSIIAQNVPPAGIGSTIPTASYYDDAVAGTFLIATRVFHARAALARAARTPYGLRSTILWLTSTADGMVLRCSAPVRGVARQSLMGGVLPIILPTGMDVHYFLVPCYYIRRHLVLVFNSKQAALYYAPFLLIFFVYGFLRCSYIFTFLHKRRQTRLYCARWTRLFAFRGQASYTRCLCVCTTIPDFASAFLAWRGDAQTSCLDSSPTSLLSLPTTSSSLSSIPWFLLSSSPISSLPMLLPCIAGLRVVLPFLSVPVFSLTAPPGQTLVCGILCIHCGLGCA